MPTSLVALQILLILLPGFSAAYVVQFLAIRATQTDFDKVIEASLYSLLIYASFVLITHGTLPFDIVSAKPPATETSIQWHPRKLGILAALAVVYGVAVAAYINRDGNAIFRKLKLTERTSRHSIWNDIFQDVAAPTQAVQVELDGGRSILGILSYYSDNAEDCSLYIKQASWVTSEGAQTPIPGNGILLTKNAGIKSISFLDMNGS